MPYLLQSFKANNDDVRCIDLFVANPNIYYTYYTVHSLIKETETQ